MNKFAALMTMSLIYVAQPALARTRPFPTTFESTGADRKAIMVLLSRYTLAVSNKNQALFESLLLNKSILFSSTVSAVKARGRDAGAQNYENFRRGMFEGTAFTQQFHHIHNEQDGPLDSVSLVFVNTDAQGSSWGWKTIQLLKVESQWKIASEFYTNHGLKLEKGGIGYDTERYGVKS